MLTNDHGYTDLVNLVSNPLEELNASELFAEHVVHKKLCMLNASKSPGLDNIHPHLLKHCADLLAFPLTCIFQKSFCRTIGEQQL